MDEDVAGLNDVDNPSPEEVDAAADQAIEDEVARRTKSPEPHDRKD